MINDVNGVYKHTMDVINSLQKEGIETIIPVKFKGGLTIDQIERFVDICVEFATEIEIGVTFESGRKILTSEGELSTSPDVKSVCPKCASEDVIWTCYCNVCNESM